MQGESPPSENTCQWDDSKMQHGCPTKDPSPVSNMHIGYTAFKRKIYRDVERESSGMAEIRKRLRNSCERLSSEEKLIFKKDIDWILISQKGYWLDILWSVS